MQIVRKRGIGFAAKMMANAAQGKVHLGKAIGCRFLFLTVNIDSTNITNLGFNKIGALNEHAAGAAAGVI